MAKVIRVPRTPVSAYDPGRKVSSLLKAHLANLEVVAQRRSGLATAKRPRTEGQASAYIAELTRQLHPEAPVAPATPVPRRRGKARAARKRTGRAKR
jgi:hypothetical protein